VSFGQSIAIDFGESVEITAVYLLDFSPADNDTTAVVTFSSGANIVVNATATGGAGFAATQGFSRESQTLVFTNTASQDNDYAVAGVEYNLISSVDVEAPVIDCPADITVNNDPGQTGAVVSFNVTATDNSGSATVDSTPASGSQFPIGSTTVTATATDRSGNQAQCSFTVTVNIFCQAGTYLADPADTFCTDASPGFFVPADGATTQTECPIGRYQDLSAAIGCKAAPIGTYVDAPAATSPTTCPAGTTTQGEGSVSSADCLPINAVPEPNSAIYLLYGLGGLVLVSLIRGRVKRHG
jgi:hypothetical protein